MKNIYVGNLSFNTSEDNLREEFGKYGQVTEVKIVHDGMTHQSRGFGFVEMANDSEAGECHCGFERGESRWEDDSRERSAAEA